MLVAQPLERLATGCRSGVRVPIEAMFYEPVQAGSGAHSGTYTMGNEPFSEIKRPKRDVDNASHPALW
jgi:hypothetical protein